MEKNDILRNYSITKLQQLKQYVELATSKEELISSICATIKDKEDMEAINWNTQFLVDWFNIDLNYIALLHNSGIENLAQLRSLSEEEVKSLNGMTIDGYRQISWARDFFDMTPIQQIPIEKRTTEEVIKKIVKHANECYRKHGDI